MITDINRTREILRSDAPRVVVEAPAGCGKTYEAVALSCDIGTEMTPDSVVLLLTHTHAAKNEFARRAATAAGANRVRISTLDAFLLEMCSPHTRALDLPHPLQGAVATGDIEFALIAEKALELVNRSAFICEVIGARYPVIVLDEHQDASITQHKVIDLIAETGKARLRFFGDPMQAIYGFGAAPMDWNDVVASADTHCALTKPWRWSKNPGLGAWIQEARSELAAGRHLPAFPTGVGITIDIVRDVPDPGYSIHFDQRLLAPVRGASYESSCAVLTYTNRRADALALQMGGSFVLNEGADFKIARDAIKQFLETGGNASALARVVVKLLGATTVGFDAAKQRQCLDALGINRVQTGRKKQVASVLAALGGIYETPTITSACRAIRDIIENPPGWIKRLTYPRNLRALALVSDSSEQPQDALESIIANDRHISKPVQRIISTIHKAKGLEYQSVLLWNFSDGDFPLTADAAKLLYVAISRACENLTIVAPGQSVSPLAPR